MERQEFLTALRGGRTRWSALLAQVPRKQMAKAGVAGHWSMKDIIAHIAWHERQMIGVIAAHALVGSDLWELPLDQRNAAIYEQNRARALAEVVVDEEQAWAELQPALEGLSDEDLNDPGLYPGMPPQWQPWDLFASNTYRHYEEHVPSIEAWLARKKG